MDGDSPDAPEAHWRSDVPDVTGISLSDLPDSVLTASLARLAAELEDADEPIAGFNSAL